MGENTVKKLDNHQVKIKEFQIVKTNLINPLKGFKAWVCKKLNIIPQLQYRYSIRISYYGTKRLMPNDVVTDSSGNIYTVLKEQNRMALLMNYQPMIGNPPLYGVLTIEGRSYDKTKKKK